MNFKAAIFDMDGLLLDTEQVCMRIFEQACHAVGAPFLKETYLSIIGCNAQRINQILTEGYAPYIDYQKIHVEWRERYNAVVLHQAIPVRSGVIEMLEWLQEHNIPCAVATSTQKDVAEVKLKLAGLDGYFANITTGCEVTHSKPAPEIYQLAAQRLNISANDCIAFEDSNNGVKAAVAAGMATFQIPDLVEPSQEVIKLGHAILPTMGDVLSHLQTKVA
ncbi:HAD family hydrolase [Vibrio agarivorans]|uniref:HAD family phosphatase n=1 Tax=Vibrio agarivorans TaxID=153622 RepID=A0ABT7Y3B9_9VIBR|nr:HAD family phosphatase [Vibrio agarivorans]MDN2482541.1 HAD family phosphatase [Vibrio agarivorans]MDN3660814.1 HAD family phosphatase [Vibrio agarivorans]